MRPSGYMRGHLPFAADLGDNECVIFLAVTRRITVFQERLFQRQAAEFSFLQIVFTTEGWIGDGGKGR